MTETTYLHFSTLNAPVALEGAAHLLPLISSVFSKWPFTGDPTPHCEAFVTIRPSPKGRWQLELDDAQAEPREWDAVNVICDLVAEIAWERIRSDPTLLCLHAAAVDFGGRLVVLPNARRSGKSTLAAVLGHLGHPIYTDDFLPIHASTHAAPFLGVANGVAPRIRLPLPEGFGADFKEWIAQDSGPLNEQYKYLLECPIASQGETMPLGAIVILDRKDTSCEMSLDEIPFEDALAMLIAQNFARTLHAGTILKSIDTIAKHLPTFRLTYHCAEAAAQFLSSHDALQALPSARHESDEPPVRLAPLEKLAQVVPIFEEPLKYVQSSGVSVSKAGDAHFLADGNGLSIFKLNSMSAAIWTLLEDPLDLNEIVEILTAAFADAEPAQIESDCKALMQNFVAAQLINPLSTPLAAQ